MTSPKRVRRQRSEAITGWREWVSFAELPLDPVVAKIDTGALSCALHATEITPITVDGKDCVQFLVHPDHADLARTQSVTAPVADFRWVRSSSGERNERFVIHTPIQIGSIRFHIDLTLVDRSSMRYPMLIGRTALRKANLLVDSRKSWLCGDEPR